MTATNNTAPSEPLYEKTCEACSIGTLPLLIEEIQDLAQELSPHWEIEDNQKISRQFRFKNFREALNFVNQVGDLADREGHHPDIELGWGRVRISLTTHKIHGLSLYDFIMASKIDRL